MKFFEFSEAKLVQEEIEYERMAFVDPVNFILKCHGFVDSNETGDVAVAVSDDFDLKPREWRYVKNDWVKV